MERLTRPAVDAPYEDRKRFGEDLYRALTKLGVNPGDEFFVTALGGRARARNQDPDTSHEAAASVDELREKQVAVLRVLLELQVRTDVGGATDEQLINRYVGRVLRGSAPKQSESGIRTRRRELVDAGFVMDSGQRMKMSTGRNAIIWIVTPERHDDVSDGLAEQGGVEAL